MRAAHARLPVPRHTAGCNGTFLHAILPALRAGIPLAAAIERTAAKLAYAHITSPTNQYTPTTHPVTIRAPMTMNTIPAITSFRMSKLFLLRLPRLIIPGRALMLQIDPAIIVPAAEVMPAGLTALRGFAIHYFMKKSNSSVNFFFCQFSHHSHSPFFISLSTQKNFRRMA